MKKVLSLLLVLVLALGMSTVAFAAKKVVDWETGGNLGPDYPSLQVEPGDVFEIGLPQGIFVLDSGATASTTGYVKSEMSKVTVMTKIAKGSKLFTAELKYADKGTTAVPASLSDGTDVVKGDAYIKIEFVDPFVSNNTDGQDFEFTTFLKVDGTRSDSLDIVVNFDGNLCNESIEEIWADTDYINLENGRIATCEEYSKNVEYYLGNGISVFGKAFKGKKYYGWSNDEATDAQADVLDKYNLDGVYNVKNVGLAAICDYVLLDDVDNSTFVYDGDLKLLGKGNDKLVLSDVYYLSSVALDIEDEEPDEDDVDAPELPADSGGDSDEVIGANDNPSTGA